LFYLHSSIDSGGGLVLPLVRKVAGSNPSQLKNWYSVLPPC